MTSSLQTSDPRTRLRMSGQADLGVWVEAALGAELWSVQRRVAYATSKYRARVAVPSCTSSGKGLAHGTLIMTPAGPRPVEDLAPGDEVLAGDGAPTKVMAVYPQPTQPRYRVAFNDGSSVLTDADHLWQVTSRGREQVVRTADLPALLRPAYWPHIPAPGPAQFSTPVPCDPYRLGVLLGDGGMTTTVALSSADPELHALFEGTPSRSRPYDRTVRGWSPLLRNLGLFGKRGEDKFVPEQFLYASPEDRLAMLQGLMDTDGGVDGAGCSFTSTSRALTEAVQHLGRSLGAWVGPVRSRVTSCRGKPGRESYRVSIAAPFPLFRLERKLRGQEKQQAARKKTYGRYISSVVQEDEGRTTCLRVEHPSALFLVQDFIVTHNTWLAGRIALAFLDAYTPGTPCQQCRGPCGGAKVITLASKFEHLRDVLWGEIRTTYAALQRRGIIVPGRMGVGQTLRMDNGPDHWIIGQSPSQAESLQGVHGAHILVIGDEATALPEEVTQGLVSSLATGDARMLLIFNPTDTSTWAYDQTMNPATEVIKIAAWDTPLFTGEDVPTGSYLLTPEYVEEMKQAGFGPGTYDWETKIEGNFWDLSDDSVIGAAWYDTALVNPGYEGTRVLGIDLAPYGSAQNVIAVRNGINVEAMLAYPSMRQDLFWAGPVTDAIRRYAPHYVIYDADGVGSGVIGYAESAVRTGRTEDHTVSLMPFRGGLKTQAKFHNYRAQAWWEVRRRFEAGNIAIRPRAHSMDLKTQLTKLKYRITPAGDIRVETKDELKKRVKDSQLDQADALVYAFHMADGLRSPGSEDYTPLADSFNLRDRSAAAMVKRDRDRLLGLSRTYDPAWD